MLALISSGPAAAAIYAAAFTMMGNGRDPRTVLMGFAMVLLSIVALPALLRLFTWITGTLASHAGGGFLSRRLNDLDAAIVPVVVTSVPQQRAERP